VVIGIIVGGTGSGHEFEVPIHIKKGTHLFDKPIKFHRSSRPMVPKNREEKEQHGTRSTGEDPLKHLAKIMQEEELEKTPAPLKEKKPSFSRL